MKYLITIIGPTAIGKTSLSIALANYFNCEIVSCDSRQFFKEMQIGTAVPSKEELLSAKHHFIQNKSISENYSVGHFEKEAIEKLEILFSTNDFAVLVGGSGLYANAVIKGLDYFPAIDSAIREEVSNNYSQFGLVYLQNQLQELDFDYFTKLKNENPQTLQNPNRMMRFVSVCKSYGKPYSSFLNQNLNIRKFTPIIIGLDAKRNILYERINQRVNNMFANGLVKEVEQLVAYKNLNALQTVGYKELFNYLEGTTTLEFAIEEIKKNTRRFSKRQLTWFKRTENTKWFDYLIPLNEITAYIKNFIQNKCQ